MYIFPSSGRGTAFNWLDADALRVVVTVTYAIAEDRDSSTDIRPRTAFVSARICRQRSSTDQDGSGGGKCGCGHGRKTCPFHQNVAKQECMGCHDTRFVCMNVFFALFVFEVVKALVSLSRSPPFPLVCCMCVLYVHLFPSHLIPLLYAWLRTHPCVCRTYLVILGCSRPRVTHPVYLLPVGLVPGSVTF